MTLTPHNLHFLTPILWWFTLQTTASLLLATTSSPLPRFSTLPILLIPAYHAITTISLLPQPYSQLQGLFALIGTSHFLSILYVKRWTLWDHGVSGDTGPIPGGWNILSGQTWRRMYRVSMSLQWSEAHHLATRKSFRWGRVVRLLVLLAVNTCASRFMAPQELMKVLRLADFLPVKHTFFRRLLMAGDSGVTVHEAVLRVALSLWGMGTPALLLEAVHVFFAVLMIYVLRWDTREEWRDFFGDLRDAYTLGGFWGRFWHHTHVSSSRDWAGLLLGLFPARIRSVRFVSRTVRLFVMFMVSGGVHATVAWQTGDKCAWTSDLWFFFYNFVVVWVEGNGMGVWQSRQEMMRVSSKEKKNQDEKSVERKSTESRRDARQEVPLFLRCLGYVYVLVFFFWATPKNMYPKIYCPYEPLLVGMQAKMAAQAQ